MRVEVVAAPMAGGQQVGIQRALGAENRGTTVWRVGGRPSHTATVCALG